MPCSFCNSPIHDIRFCNSQMIDILYERIKVIYVDILNENQNTGNIEIRFKGVLNRRFNLKQLRAVGVKFLHTTARLNKTQYMEIMYQHYSSRIYTIPEEQPWLETQRLPTQPDPIPDFARDIEEPASPDDYDITWYIDTTPTPVSVLSFPILTQLAQQRPNYTQMRHVQSATGRENSIYYREPMRGLNLMAHFNAVSGNIPFTPQIKKYDIKPKLIIEEEQEKEEEEEDCAICFESIKCMDLVKLNCSHKFCGNCINGSLKSHNNIYCGPSCALCRTQMVSFSVKNPEIYNLVSEYCNL